MREFRPIVFAVLFAALLAPAAPAQNGRPLPAAPETVPVVEDEPDADVPADQPGDADGPDGSSRRAVPDDKVILAFDDVSVEDTIKFIAETTGKVVMPVRLQTLRTQKITLLNDEPIDRARALDLLFSAFRLNDIGVIERDDRIIIGALPDIVNLLDMPVIGPDEDIMVRGDLGNFVMKIYKLTKADAQGVGDQIAENLPDYAGLTVDPNSNQIVLVGDVGLAQQVQLLIDELDRAYFKVHTKTYRLRYADASEIADNILELFESDPAAAATRTASTRTRRTTAARGRTAANAQQPTTPGQPGPVAELKLTVNGQQNTVTVQADPQVIDDIDRLIDEYWDLPRPEGTSKQYTLKYTDPIKVRDMLQQLLEQGGGGRSTTTRTAGGAGGARTGVTEVISGVYRIEAYPDSNSLLVLAKTEETFAFLDSIVWSLDQPSTVGLPIVVELKHADAGSLADEVNVLLAEAGANVTINRPDQGLSGSFGDDATGGTTGGATGREAEEGGEFRFPWQTGGRSRDDQTPETPLIGKIRVVPIIRQNALAIVSPPPYQEIMREFIQYLDRPGRQVLIEAVIAEVELNDELAMGLRVSRGDIPLNLLDNSIGGSASGTAREEGFLDNLFDTSSLDVNFSVNAALQLLAQKTNVRILQQPRIFTADNQEAIFFDGQDVPFITNSNTTDLGGITQSFDYRQVGVMLNVRPRITAQQDVNLEVYLELSSIVPGQTLFGGFIVDRRTSTTNIVIEDQQTIVLSGILRDTESDIVRKMPLLGDLPLVGGLFRSTDKSKVTTELVAFITPRVVNSPSENNENFNVEARQRLRELLRPLSEVDADYQRDSIRERVGTPGVRAPNPGAPPDGQP